MIDLQVLIDGGVVTLSAGPHSGAAHPTDTVNFSGGQTAWYMEVGAPLAGAPIPGEPAAFPAMVGTCDVFDAFLNSIDADGSWDIRASAYLLEGVATSGWPSPPSQPTPFGRNPFPPAVDPSTLRMAYESGETGVCKQLELDGWFPLGSPPTWRAVSHTIDTVTAQDLGTIPLGDLNFGREPWLYVLYEIIDWSGATHAIRNVNPALPKATVKGQAPQPISLPWPYQATSVAAVPTSGGSHGAAERMVGGGSPLTQLPNI